MARSDWTAANQNHLEARSLTWTVMNSGVRLGLSTRASARGLLGGPVLPQGMAAPGVDLLTLQLRCCGREGPRVDGLEAALPFVTQSQK